MEVKMFDFQKIKDKITLEVADESCSRGLKVTQAVVLDSVEDVDGDELVYVLKKEYPNCFCISAREAYFLLKIGTDTQKLHTYHSVMKMCEKKAA